MLDAELLSQSNDLDFQSCNHRAVKEQPKTITELSYCVLISLQTHTLFDQYPANTSLSDPGDWTSNLSRGFIFLAIAHSCYSSGELARNMRRLWKTCLSHSGLGLLDFHLASSLCTQSISYRADLKKLMLIHGNADQRWAWSLASLLCRYIALILYLYVQLHV